MWAYTDLNDRAKRRAQLMGDADFKKYLDAAVPLIEHQQNRILEPAAFFSPILDAMVAAADSHCSDEEVEAIERSAEISPEVLNNTNRMRLHVFANGARDQALLVAIYDNLGKGASGAAVQNLNLMIGADERLGADLKIAA